MKPATLSILIPVYNEQSYLARIVERVMAAPVPDGLQKEIVIVNDASNDRTSAVLQELCARYPEIRVFEQPVNMGKGAAIRRAIQEMTGQFAIIQDADLEYDPNDYPLVLKPLLDGQADVVYGSRFATRDMRRIVHYYHKLANLFLTHLSNWATGLDLTDMETCYKAFRSELVKSIPLRSNRFGIEPELTAKLAKRGVVFYEVPISYHGRRYDEGKKIGWKDGVSAIWTIFKYWLFDDCYSERKHPFLLRTIEHARNYTRSTVKLVTKWYGDRVIELGSKTGDRSRLLPQRLHLMLTDDDPEFVEWLNQQYEGNATVTVQRLDIINSDDVKQQAAKEQFDTAVMFYRLAELEQDAAALRHIKNLIVPGGKLVLTLPNHPLFYSAADKEANRHRRYSKSKIKKLLTATGYKIVYCKSYNFLGLPVYFVNSVLLGRQRLGKYQLKLYNSFVPFFALIEKCVPLPGLDLLVVAEPYHTSGKINDEDSN